MHLSFAPHNATSATPLGNYFPSHIVLDQNQHGRVVGPGVFNKTINNHYSNECCWM